MYFLPKSFSFLCLLFCLVMAATVSAQTARIEGHVNQLSPARPLEFANVALMQLSDSTYVAAAMTDSAGYFSLEKLRPGAYSLDINMLGYEALKRRIDLAAGEHVQLSDLVLSEKAVLLEGVEIKEKRMPIQIKNDTIEYDAGSFPTREDAVVEDLLRKLPGVEVNRQGEVKAMGEKVNEVLVDGKPFFGEDPLIATRNLPANIIDKVQVFDKQSEQAEFSQIDDGNSSKAINLSLKEEARTGVFGRLSAGAGTEDRYQLNGNYNRFGPDSQWSLIGSGNNVNDAGFSISDMLNSGALDQAGDENGNVSLSIGPPGGGSGGGGISESWSGGVNFRESGWKKHTLSGAYFYNQNSNVNGQEVFRQNLGAENETNYDAFRDSRRALFNHRSYFRWDYRLDSFHSILFKPDLSWARQDNRSSQDYITRNAEGGLINAGSNHFESSILAPALDASLLFRKKFRKKSRAFSLQMDANYNERSGDESNLIANRFVQDQGEWTDSLDQRTDVDRSNLTTGLRASYTEPLRRHRYLEWHYGWSRTANASARHAFARNPLSGNYDLENPDFTNVFDSRYNIQEAGMNIKIEKLKYNYTIGLTAQDYSLESVHRSADTSISRRALSLFPVAIFKYSFSSQKRFKMVYKGNTEQPGLSQLQPVADVSDPQYVRIGNPELEPQFSHRLTVGYNSFGMKNMSSFFSELTLSLTDDRIVDDITLLEDGRQLVRPRNGENAYTAMLFMGSGLPVKKWNMDFGLNALAMADQNVSYINSIANTTKTMQLSPSLRATYYYKEMLDFGASGGVGYNQTHYSLQKALNTRYFNYSAGADMQLRLPFGMIFRADVQYNRNTGGSGLYNRRNTLLNASIGQQFFKKRAQVQLRVFDLLKQNISVSRSATDIYLEDVRSTVLQQYWMLTLSWSLNQFGEQGPGIFRFR